MRWNRPHIISSNPCVNYTTGRSQCFQQKTIFQNPAIHLFPSCYCFQKRWKTEEDKIRRKTSTSVASPIPSSNQRFIFLFIMRTINSFRRWRHYGILTSYKPFISADLKQHSVKAYNRAAALLCSKSISLLICSSLCCSPSAATKPQRLQVKMLNKSNPLKQLICVKIASECRIWKRTTFACLSNVCHIKDPVW